MKSFLSDRPRVDAPARAQASGSVSSFVAPVVSRQSAGAASFHAHAPVADKNAAGAGEGATRVECVREGDRVARVIVTCACGERIEIDCLYGAGG